MNFLPRSFVFSLLTTFLFAGATVRFDNDFAVASEAISPEKATIDDEASETPKDSDWVSLFDGKSLFPWVDSEYVGGGKIEIVDDAIQLETGVMGTAIRYENEEKPFPKMNYEFEYEARRTSGVDFFAALTFPVGDDYCSFINGGWGGTVVGLSSIDGMDASENSSSSYRAFKDKVWYQFRVRVTENRIQVWIDDEETVDVNLEDHSVSTRIEVDSCKPIGFSSWITTGQIRAIRYRLLNDAEK